jgi:uncharacterized membrane protein
MLQKIGLRRINFFEVVLLVVGLCIGVVGFKIVNMLYQMSGSELSYDLFITIFLWLILIVLLILAATMEDVKEELAIVIREHISETRVLRNINRETLEEIRLLNNIKREEDQELRYLKDLIPKKAGKTKRK